MKVGYSPLYIYYELLVPCNLNYLLEETDFGSTTLTATIAAGATTTTVRVPVMSDNIVEGDEIFSMMLIVLSSLGPGIVAGSITSATAVIVDSTTGWYCHSL